MQDAKRLFGLILGGKFVFDALAFERIIVIGAYPEMDISTPREEAAESVTGCAIAGRSGTDAEAGRRGLPSK